MNSSSFAFLFIKTLKQESACVFRFINTSYATNMGRLQLEQYRVHVVMISSSNSMVSFSNSTLSLLICSRSVQVLFEQILHIVLR
jgi:hypothetical protein